MEGVLSPASVLSAVRTRWLRQEGGGSLGDSHAARDSGPPGAGEAGRRGWGLWGTGVPRPVISRAE